MIAEELENTLLVGGGRKEVVEGYIRGETVRLIVPFVVSRKDEAQWILVLALY